LTDGKDVISSRNLNCATVCNCRHSCNYQQHTTWVTFFCYVLCLCVLISESVTLNLWFHLLFSESGLTLNGAICFE